MSLKKFIAEAVSPWMKQKGPASDIVLSSRIRFARNLEGYPFPVTAPEESAQTLMNYTTAEIDLSSFQAERPLHAVTMDRLSSNERRILVEKHLISPYLADKSTHGALLLSGDESISIMINEEDHLRLQCLLPGFQLKEGLETANKVDDWLEGKVTYAYDEELGYLTSCPTNVGTGMRASVMMHLPALVMTQQLNRMMPAVNQVGLAVRGIYGEGSEALGNLFQISNQVTLGKSEQDIVDELEGVVDQLLQQERKAREHLLNTSRLQLEDRMYRSYGQLRFSRIMESKESAQRLSDVRFAIDAGLLQGVSGDILNELMVLTQPAMLQQYAGAALSPGERDERRASLIRERLKLEEQGDELSGGGSE
ncbi:protein arginine kinase [Salsuginibacillus halophilus]|uniref:Protein-arginine kinase n=1 Tax=Salsuginibacillus halophilus TaxID=517424 RepID=A0A2P8H523_9BACI|nr:protein arginine kinase [Salsuginibacillus halophilus]PSL41294.1 protein arginine kinase [Salsuginibacillus halophilus]